MTSRRKAAIALHSQWWRPRPPSWRPEPWTPVRRHAARSRCQGPQATRVNDPGVYCVQLKDGIKAVNVANVMLTIDYFNTATATNISAQWYSPDLGVFWCFGNGIAVKTYGNEGGTSALVDAAFTIGIS